MLLTVPQKYLDKLLKMFGAMKKEQAEKLLKMEYPYANYFQTVKPLKNLGLVTEKDGFIFGRDCEINSDSITAIEIMLTLETEKIDTLQKGISPFTLTFFRIRDGKLWRYDICVVHPGREGVVCAALEGLYAKYRVIVFVLEDPDQQKDIYVSCDFCFVWKEKGEYHFYKEVKSNDGI